MGFFSLVFPPCDRHWVWRLAGAAGKLAALCLTSYIDPPAGVSPVDHDCGALLHAGGGGGGGGERHHTLHLSHPLLTGTEAPRA